MSTDQRLQFPRDLDHFTDEVIYMVEQRGRALTTEERVFLETTTPRFEECSDTEEDLRKLSDAELMYRARGVWSDYASGQI